MKTTNTDLFTGLTYPAGSAVLMPERFLKIAMTKPDLPAVYWPEGSWTYGKLAERALRYAALISRRVPEGGWVALCASRTPETVAVMLGAFLSGRAVVPLEPLHPVNRLRATLEDLLPALLIVDYTAARELTLGYEGEKGLLDELAAEAMLFDPQEESTAVADDVAYVVFTSGSTGVPKGAMVQHGQLAELIDLPARGDGPPIREGTTTLSVASLAHDMMVTDIFVPLALGASVSLPPMGTSQKEPIELLDCIERDSVDLIIATPSLLYMLVLAGLGAEERRQVRVVTAGEALPRDLASRLLERCVSVHHGYGPTETTVLTSLHEVSDPDRLPLGRPFAGTTYYPVDMDLRILPFNTRAELAIGGVQVCAGYHERPRLTAEKFRPDPYSNRPGARCYLSGDMVKVYDNGDVMFVGRRDDQVKVRGYRVELGEVQAAMSRCAGVQQCVCLAEKDAQDRDILAAYVVGDTQRLREQLADELPAVMIPSRIVKVAEIPLTTQGKVDRDALLAMHDKGNSTQSGDTRELTETETRIAALWGEVLGRESVGVDQEFFELGGHSLLAMEIVARIKSEFGVDLVVWELFSKPSVRAWAAAMDQAVAEKCDGGEQLETYPVSYAQAVACIAEQVAPGCTSPGFLFSYMIDGRFDIGGLANAIEFVAARHAVLRTRFELRGAYSLQVIEPYVEIDLDDVVCVDEDELSSRINGWLGRPYSLTQGPLFRVMVAETAGVRSVHFNFHDTICDEDSARKIVVEILTGGGEQMDWTKQSFADIAAEERRIGRSAETAQLVARWKERLKRPLGSVGNVTTDCFRLLLRPEQVPDLVAAQGDQMRIEAALLDRARLSTGATTGAVLRKRSSSNRSLVGPLTSMLLVPFTSTDDVLADLEWAEANAVAAELLQLHLADGDVAVPQVVVAVRVPERDEPLQTGESIWTPMEFGSSTQVPGQRTGIDLAVELRVPSTHSDVWEAVVQVRRALADPEGIVRRLFTNLIPPACMDEVNRLGFGGGGDGRKDRCYGTGEVPR